MTILRWVILYPVVAGWGRQVTGWIVSVRRDDLVKEISQTCDRSATIRGPVVIPDTPWIGEW